MSGVVVSVVEVIMRRFEGTDSFEGFPAFCAKRDDVLYRSFWMIERGVVGIGSIVSRVGNFRRVCVSGSRAGWSMLCAWLFWRSGLFQIVESRTEIAR